MGRENLREGYVSFGHGLERLANWCKDLKGDIGGLVGSLSSSNAILTHFFPHANDPLFHGVLGYFYCVAAKLYLITPISRFLHDLPLFFLKFFSKRYHKLCIGKTPALRLSSTITSINASIDTQVSILVISSFSPKRKQIIMISQTT